MSRLLWVDDESSLADTMAEMFKLKGFTVEKSGTFEQTMAALEACKPDLVCLDLDLAGNGHDLTGLEILKQIRARWTSMELPVIVVSGAGNTSLLRELMEHGADDYETKPVDFRDMLEKVRRFIQRSRPSPAPASPSWQEDIIGKSKLMMNLTLNVWRASRMESNVLILGETGTGKDLVAHVYHKSSPRCGRRFYEIDCTNIQTNLFESELFGYVPGAFTEAKKIKKGKVEEADGGILFFNEIGELPWEQQGKFLTLLESKTFTRVGSNDPITVDVVILAATNRDLYSMVEAGRFRKDLFYRLFNQVIVNPPLRDHLEDVPLLVDYFIRKYSAKMQKPVAAFEEGLLEEFKQFSWPGNVRQLQNCVRVGVQNCVDAVIRKNDVADWMAHFDASSQTGSPLSLTTVNPDVNYAEQKRQLEKQINQKWKEYLLHHLQKQNWNVSRTAEKIGVSREYLNQMIKRLEIIREK